MIFCIRTVSRKRCEQMFKNKGFDYAITERMICAGGTQGTKQFTINEIFWFNSHFSGKDGCQGDRLGSNVIVYETFGSILGVLILLHVIIYLLGSCWVSFR